MLCKKPLGCEEQFYTTEREMNIYESLRQTAG